jgi:hypothetical protein
MTDTAHRAASGRSIRKMLDDAHRARLARRAQGENQRTSLIKLALTSLDLHATSLAKDVLPRTDDERSKPLLVALTALETIIRNEGV